jgi:hypothetical protein
MLRIKNDTSKYMTRAAIGRGGSIVPAKPTPTEGAKRKKDVTERIRASATFYVNLDPKPRKA